MSSTPTPADPLPETSTEAVAQPGSPVPQGAPESASPDAAPALNEAADVDTAAAEPASTDTAAPAAAMSPAECGQQLKARFPGLFAGAPKPLKLRVQADIQARAPGVFTKAVLSAFLRRHTGATSYLIALSKATHRFDLDGQPADELLPEHRQVALDELARRREVTASRRAEEDQQRRNRAQLLRDFEKTTLTRANFCALKGLPEAELDGILEIARKEAAEAPPRPAHHDPRDRRGPRGDDRGPRGPRRDDRGPGGPRGEHRRGGRPDARGPRRDGHAPRREAAGPRPPKTGGDEGNGGNSGNGGNGGSIQG